MKLLSDFAIAKKWPAQHPDRLQLYSRPTPNGVKVSIMLEETGLPYEAHSVSFARNEQKSPEFLALNPYGRIPAIIDPDAQGAGALGLFETGAILLYLAEKTGKFLPTATVARYETLQWLIFQVAGIGPMFGQVGFFHKFAGKEFEDKRPRDRYVGEVQQQLQALELRLADRHWVMGDEYTIADMAIFPWVRNLIVFYDAGALVGIDRYPNVLRVLESFKARPAVIRGLNIPPRD
jgi:GST-like protein